MNQQEYLATNFRELITELAEKNDKLLKDYDTVAQTCDEQKDEIARLKKELAAANERLHWIWAIGVDYDGYKGSAKDLEELIDEMVEFTQMTDIEAVDTAYKKGAADAATKITHYLYPLWQDTTSKNVAIGSCLDWIKSTFGV
jgi:predicted nuclease with TOPRIM domain